MKRTIIAAMLLSLAVGSLALADPPQGYDHQHHDEHHHRVEHGHHGPSRFMMTGRYVGPHGYHTHSWHRGDRLPPEYRGSAYVIPDVAVYHLRPPPRGYYWVRVDNNAVLAAIATGVVVDVSLNLFH
ncbi:MAG: RcnB family protein [Steroidobacteraceae bacterium]